eukprot:gene15453-18333_t
MLLKLVTLLALLVCLASANTAPSIPYSQEIGINHVLMTYISYCDTQQVLDWTCSRCGNFPGATNPQIIFNNETVTRAMIVTYNNTVYVAFRGSEGTMDWIENFEFLRTDYPGVEGAKVHDGFYHSWLSVAEEVKAGMIDNYKKCPTCTKVSVFGHSYGAAVSTFATLEVATWFPDLFLESFTIGSPRAGNDVFAAYYNTIQPNTWRVVNQRDVVPHLPPKHTINEYHHVSNVLNWTCLRCANFPGASDPKIIYNNVTVTRAVVVTYNNTINVAFRGSDGTEDWIENFEFLRTDYPGVEGAKVHYGFYHAWLSVAEDIKAAMIDNYKKCPTCTNVRVHGHSYGAADRQELVMMYLQRTTTLFNQTHGESSIKEIWFHIFHQSTPSMNITMYQILSPRGQFADQSSFFDSAREQILVLSGDFKRHSRFAVFIR